MGVSQNYGYHFKGLYIKGYNILGSILGSPYFGKLPYGSFKNRGGDALGAHSGLNKTLFRIIYGTVVLRISYIVCQADDLVGFPGLV